MSHAHVSPRRGLPRPVSLILILIVLVAVIGGAVLAGSKLLDSFSTKDYSGQGSGMVTIQVAAGDTSADIGATLEGKDVVKSAKAFTKAAKGNSKARGIQPGFYVLRLQMSGKNALTLLLDPSSRSRSRVTIPEGTTLAVALDRIAKNTEVKLADLQAAVAKPAALGLPSYAKGQVEGFLFPATYDIEPGTSATEALKSMVDRFKESAASLDLVARAKALDVSPYEVLITASLIEKETAFPADRSKVARVVYNRLDKNMPLQFDSTVNYLREEKKARLTLDDLKVESDYNTYDNKGLPPTPIDSPGEAAIDAALTPATGDYVYFVTVSKTGQSLFTNDYPQFLAAKDKAKREGVY